MDQQNRYLDFLINPRFQGVNRLFDLPIENTGVRTSYTIHFLLLLDIKNYNVVNDGWNFFDQEVRNNIW